MKGMEKLPEMDLLCEECGCVTCAACGDYAHHPVSCEINFWWNMTIRALHKRLRSSIIKETYEIASQKRLMLACTKRFSSQDRLSHQTLIHRYHVKKAMEEFESMFPSGPQTGGYFYEVEVPPETAEADADFFEDVVINSKDFWNLTDRNSFCLMRFIKHSDYMASAREQFLGLKEKFDGAENNPLKKINSEVNLGSLSFYLYALKFLIKSRRFLASTYIMRHMVFDREDEVSLNNTQSYFEVTIDSLTKFLKENPPESLIEVDPAEYGDEEDEVFLVKDFSQVKANILRIVNKGQQHFEAVQKELASWSLPTTKKALEEKIKLCQDMNEKAQAEALIQRTQGVYPYFNTVKVVQAWKCDACGKEHHIDDNSLESNYYTCSECGFNREMLAEVVRINFLPYYYSRQKIGYSTKSVKRAELEAQYTSKVRQKSDLRLLMRVKTRNQKTLRQIKEQKNEKKSLIFQRITIKKKHGGEVEKDLAEVEEVEEEISALKDLLNIFQTEMSRLSVLTWSPSVEKVNHSQLKMMVDEERKRRLKFEGICSGELKEPIDEDDIILDLNQLFRKPEQKQVGGVDLLLKDESRRMKRLVQAQ